MAKFVIDSVLIEKSDKDIKQNEKYNFSDGFNLISGNNEAGKSSLMRFIKEGLFKEKGVDTGKIFFSCDNNSYRADIKDDRTTDKRCKIFDGNNNSCSYDLINKLLNEQYFKEGFYISLDDLMKIQMKDTSSLVNVIKDPSGEYLNERIKKFDDEINSVLGKDNKLKKDVKEILYKISEIDSKINQLIKKENEYNNSVNTIKSLDEDIALIRKKEEFIKLNIESANLKEKLNVFNSQKQQLELKFNKKLSESQKMFFEIIEQTAKYNSNIEQIEKNKQKIELLNAKISASKVRIPIQIDESMILTFSSDYGKTLKIKENIEKSNDINSEIKSLYNKKSDLENEIIKLEQNFNTKFKDENFEKLNILEEKINENLKQFHFLSSSVNKSDNENQSLKSNKTIFVIMIILIILLGINCFVQWNKLSSFISITGIIACISGIIFSFSINSDNETANQKAQIKNIINNLKSELSALYPELNKLDYTYIPIKLESIRQDILEELKNQKEKLITEAQISALIKKEEELKDSLNTLNNETEALKEIDVELKQYLETVEIINSMKNDIRDKKILLDEINTSEKENAEILERVKNFIIDNDIKINFGEDLRAVVHDIKEIADKNNEIKKELDIIDNSINIAKNNINEINVQKQNYEIDINEISLEDNSREREELLNKKKEAEFTKRQLEQFEGISDLRIEKSILLDEYRKIIKKLFANKMTLELITMAKKEFDKTQPDLINAQKYLEIMTGGKYSIINLELEEIANKDGTVIKKWENLSRGTREQLYFALRLGYASNYSKDKTTLETNGKPDLPIMADDIFVNFDVERAKNAIKCLFDFSKTNQVLFFTCRSDEIKQMLDGEKYNIINM